MASRRQQLGALLYDCPRYLRTMWRGEWWRMRNRAERTVTNGKGIRCEWEFTSELHIANVFPSLGMRLMRAAFAQWPVVLRDAPVATSQVPQVSFVIGHRGLDRLPHLLATLRSIAGQSGARIEAIVVEQSFRREIEERIPSWVRYIHTPTPLQESDYNRSWTLNVGTRAARSEIVVLHDNDMIVPAGYAAELLARVEEGFDFFDLKRFTFYVDEPVARRVFDTGVIPEVVSSRIVQNLQGASIAAVRNAYFAVGGFDEAFVGWGGEDNEFWERALTSGKVFRFGYLPFLHLWHAPQKGKLMGGEAPAVKRYYDLRDISPQQRIEQLTKRR